MCCRASFLEALRDTESDLTPEQRDAMEAIREDVDQPQEESWVSLMDSVLASAGLGEHAVTPFYEMLKDKYGGVPDFHTVPTLGEIRKNEDRLVKALWSRAMPPTEDSDEESSDEESSDKESS